MRRRARYINQTKSAMKITSDTPPTIKLEIPVLILNMIPNGIARIIPMNKGARR